jgi:hypothetical protein
MTVDQTTFTTPLRTAAQAIEGFATDTVPTVVDSGVDAVASTAKDVRRWSPRSDRSNWWIGLGLVVAGLLAAAVIVKRRRNDDGAQATLRGVDDQRRVA